MHVINKNASLLVYLIGGEDGTLNRTGSDCLVFVFTCYYAIKFSYTYWRESKKKTSRIFKACFFLNINIDFINKLTHESFHLIFCSYLGIWFPCQRRNPDTVDRRSKNSCMGWPIVLGSQYRGGLAQSK